MKRLVFILALLGGQTRIHANPFNQIDSIAITSPPELTNSIHALIQYCRQSAQTEPERVRFYFTWLTTHINYDFDITHIDERSQDPETVFRTRKGICSGFARLFGYLCQETGLPARYISGYGKIDASPSSVDIHAWNVVRIDGKWYLFDLTWATDEYDPTRPFEINTNMDMWFMADPLRFGWTHLPFDPAFQLCEDLKMPSDFFEDTMDTEGGTIDQTCPSFSALLDAEMGLDSIEKTWLSFRRAWDFMPKDSAVAIKLARVQDAKIKRVFADIRAFQDRYPFINQMSLSELENWQNTFSQLEKKTLDAMILQAELSQLPLTEANKKAVRQNQVFYETILNFFHKAIEGVAVEVSGRR
jgi:hypothetical protein